MATTRLSLSIEPPADADGADPVKSSQVTQSIKFETSSQAIQTIKSRKSQPIANSSHMINAPSTLVTEILTSTQVSKTGNHLVFSALPNITKFFREVVPVEDFGPSLLIRETISCHKHLRQRLREMEQVNINNDQIVLFFVGTPDRNGRSWHADSNLVERAVDYMLKKLQIGGFFLKIHVGNRSEWLDVDNVFKKDTKFELVNIPTLWVWGSSKRIFGKRCFDLESVYLLLKD